MRLSAIRPAWVLLRRWPSEAGHDAIAAIGSDGSLPRLTLVGVGEFIRDLGQLIARGFGGFTRAQQEHCSVRSELK